MRAASYVDTSALFKLLVRADESAALRSWLMQNDPLLVTSELAVAELTRSVRRKDPGLTGRVKEVLDLVALIPVTRSVLHTASSVAPPTVRTLDAVHLATALKLAESLDWVITYDTRMREAAASMRFPVVAPRGI